MSQSILAAKRFSAILVVVALGACAASPEVTSGFKDPYEAQNREVHELNKEIDQTLLRGASTTYLGVPVPVRTALKNFSGNFSTPGDVVNDLLQLNIEDAAHNLVRFLFNTTLGIGGLLDPSTHIGLAARPSDFGETLHTWGVGEGNYVELPILGPSTERDTIGMIVDFFINPLSRVLPSPEKYAGTVAGIAAKIGARAEYSKTFDSILYDSADSYAQARLLYLENRRFELGQNSDSDYIDPYDDFIPQ